MFAERPSDKKVMAVSRAYARDRESQLNFNDIKARFASGELEDEDLTSKMHFCLDFEWAINIIKPPIRRRRQRFLEYVRHEVEGFAPDERFEEFALRRTGRAALYPLFTQEVAELGKSDQE